ncbi:MAG: HTH domain-containing protein [Clostridia bacterium]|nr:HTH domain-containing protein [Clostridia bacterium]
MVRKALPSKEYEVYEADVPQDVIAINSGIIIINSDNSNKEAIDMFIDFLCEVGGYTDQTIFWLGKIRAPRKLDRFIKYRPTFEDLEKELKYAILSAFRKSKKTTDFSKKIADCIVVLSLIRSNPGIKTKELSEKLELPMRTIQRYISTLQAAGEWIEYDYNARGWKLQHGISILFGDHLNY